MSSEQWGSNKDAENAYWEAQWHIDILYQHLDRLLFEVDHARTILNWAEIDG